MAVGVQEVEEAARFGKWQRPCRIKQRNEQKMKEIYYFFAHCCAEDGQARRSRVEVERPPSI